MEPQKWLQNALDELLGLAPVAEDDPDDAWRAVVLVARLLGSPSGPPPPADVLLRLSALLARAGLPEPEPLLERLTVELTAEDDPAGPLLDVLLDIDDCLGALSVSGGTDQAEALSQRAAERISRFAARTGPLKDFAELRGATVRPGSAAAMLWSAVPQESEKVAREYTPRSPRATRLPPVRLPPAAVLSLPRQATYLRAWTGAPPLAFASQDQRTRAWLYEEAGRLRLELRGTTVPPARARLDVSRRKGRKALASMDLPLEVSGNTAYANLGPAVGRGNLLHALLTRAGIPPEQADVRLVVMHDDG